MLWCSQVVPRSRCFATMEYGRYRSLAIPCCARRRTSAGAVPKCPALAISGFDVAVWAIYLAVEAIANRLVCDDLVDSGLIRVFSRYPREI